MATSINDQMHTRLTSLASDKSKSSSATQSLNMQTTDWMTLLVAQLKNQDLYNTKDSTEYTNQMAQYSMIQALNNLTSVNEDMYATNYTAYASSLMGKEVTVAKLDDKGEMVTEKGVVSGVTLFESEPKIYIGKNAYTLNQIMIVGNVETQNMDQNPPDDDESKAGGDGSGDKTTQ